MSFENKDWEISWLENKKNLLSSFWAFHFLSTHNPTLAFHIVALFSVPGNLPFWVVHYWKIVNLATESREGKTGKDESNFGKENTWKLRICKLIFLKLCPLEIPHSKRGWLILPSNIQNLEFLCP